MSELPDLTDWNDMFEFPFKMKKEDYLKTFDNIDALTFVTNGIDIFGNDLLFCKLEVSGRILYVIIFL